jgi:hypothetical protein
VNFDDLADDAMILIIGIVRSKINLDVIAD